MGIFKDIATVAVGIATVVTGQSDSVAKDYASSQRAASKDRHSSIERSINNESRSSSGRTHQSK